MKKIKFGTFKLDKTDFNEKKIKLILLNFLKNHNKNHCLKINSFLNNDDLLKKIIKDFNGLLILNNEIEYKSLNIFETENEYLFFIEDNLLKKKFIKLEEEIKLKDIKNKILDENSLNKFDKKRFDDVKKLKSVDFFGEHLFSKNKKTLLSDYKIVNSFLLPKRKNSFSKINKFITFNLKTLKPIFIYKKSSEWIDLKQEEMRSIVWEFSSYDFSKNNNFSKIEKEAFKEISSNSRNMFHNDKNIFENYDKLWPFFINIIQSEDIDEILNKIVSYNFENKNYYTDQFKINNIIFDNPFDVIVDIIENDLDEKKGIKSNSVSIKEDKLIISSNFYEVIATKNENNSISVEVKSFINFEEYGYFINGIRGFFNKHLTKQKRKISFFKEIIFPIVSLILFGVLTYLTFSLVFSEQDFIESFKIIGSSFTTGPWIYMLIFSTFIQVNTSIILALILQPKGEKDIKKVIKNAGILYLSGRIRWLSRALTGSYLFSLFVWGLLLTKLLNKRKTSIVGRLSAVTFVSAIIALIFNLSLVTIGTIFIVMINNPNYDFYWVLNGVTIIAWFSVFWIFLTSMILPFITFWKPLNNLFFSYIINIVIFKQYFSKKTEDYFSRARKIELRFYQIRKELPKTIKNKRTLKRIVYAELFLLFNLMIESWGAFNIVNQANGISSYWNPITLASSRWTIKMSTDFLIIPNMLVPEIALKQLYSSLYYWMSVNHLFGSSNINQIVGDTITLNNGNVLSIDSLSSTASLISRTWGHYIPLLYSMLFSMIAITVLVYKKQKNKYNYNKAFEKHAVNNVK